MTVFVIVNYILSELGKRGSTWNAVLWEMPEQIFAVVYNFAIDTQIIARPFLLKCVNDRVINA